jgi:hypothetical protein
MRWFGLATTSMLALGLYVATAGIDNAVARHHKWLIGRVLTIGVGLKIVLIGAVMLIFGDWRLLTLAPAMAQIDPLGVAALEERDRMSEQARTILGAWAAFDDPITVVVTWARLPHGAGSVTGPLADVKTWRFSRLLAAFVVALVAGGGPPAR